jgi:hypothetical protein
MQDNEYGFIARAKDTSGNMSNGSLPVTVTIDTIIPSVPMITAVDGITSGTTADDTPTVTGTCEVGSEVQVFATHAADPLISLGHTDCTAGGDYTITPITPLAINTYDFVAKASDAAGNVSNESVPIVITVDTTQDQRRADVNNDNSVRVADAQLILRRSVDLHASGWVDGPTVGDVNCSNSVNVADAQLVLRWAVNLSTANWCDVQFPVHPDN